MNATHISLAYGPTVSLVSPNATELTDEQNAQFRAFALVCPQAWGRSDWKEQVSAVLTEADLEVAGVTIDAVCDAVRFYTATEPTVSKVATSNPEVFALVVRADGYRRGPAH